MHMFYIYTFTNNNLLLGKKWLLNIYDMTIAEPESKITLEHDYLN